jgi:hypothetical protein
MMRKEGLELLELIEDAKKTLNGFVGFKKN